jgi:hypothetical protein
VRACVETTTTTTTTTKDTARAGVCGTTIAGDPIATRPLE